MPKAYSRYNALTRDEHFEIQCKLLCVPHFVTNIEIAAKVSIEPDIFEKQVDWIISGVSHQMEPKKMRVATGKSIEEMIKQANGCPISINVRMRIERIKTR